MPVKEGTQLKDYLVVATNPGLITDYNPRRLYTECVDETDAIAKMVRKSGMDHEKTCRHKFRAVAKGTEQYEALVKELNSQLPDAKEDGPTIDDDEKKSGTDDKSKGAKK